MQAYWTQNKADGTPITDGRVCRVVDPEDGTEPIRVYGRTEAEVFSKIERTMVTAQSTLSEARGTNGRVRETTPPARETTAPQNPAILSADETMRLTQDLQNPAKSAEASYKLAESERAKRDQAQQNYLAVCKQWAAQNPQFYQHKANRQLLITKALLEVGNDISRITLEVLDDVYRYLEGRGDLLTENDVVAQAPSPTTDPPSQVQPDGSLSVVPPRPRSSVVSASSHRSSRMGAPQAPQWKPKFTLEEINKLSTKDTAALNQPGHPRHKDYVEACNYWYSGAQATA